MIKNIFISALLVVSVLLIVAIGLAATGQKAPPSNVKTTTIMQETQPATQANPTEPKELLAQLTAAEPAIGEEINWQVISSGGASGASADYQLVGTVGQPAVGSGSSGDYGLTSGFWSVPEFQSSPAGWLSVSLSGLGAQQGKILCDQTVVFNIRLSNKWAGYVKGMCHGFRLYSPEGATWQVPTYDSAGGLDVYLDHFVYTGGRHVTGSLADTIWIAGCYYSLSGIPEGYNDVILWIATEVDCSEAGKTLCIDSSYFPPGGDWLWATSEGAYTPHWYGPYCYTIAVLKGDADHSGSVDVGDLTYLVAYLFQGGPPPPNPEEGDVNGDGQIDVADLTYLVAYLFQGGPPPPARGSAGAHSARTGKNSCDITLTTAHEDGATMITLESPVDIRGIQIDLSGERTGEPESMVDTDLEFFFRQDSNSARIGILDLEGVALITKGTCVLVRLPGEYEIVEAVVSDLNHHALVPTINSAAKSATLPTEFALHQNYPNPFNPTTQINFSLPEAADVRLEVYNIMGQKVATLIDKRQEAGEHTVQWDGSSFASGVYFYRLQTGDLIHTKKMVLLK